MTSLPTRPALDRRLRVAGHRLGIPDCLDCARVAIMTVLRLILLGLLGCAVLGLAGWGALAIWYALPAGENVRLALAAGLVGLAVVGLVVAVWRGRVVRPLAPFALAGAALLGWWITVTPSNDRDWQTDVARLPAAEIDGDLVTLSNVRRFTYQDATTFEPDWHERTVDLNTLEALDLFAVYWMGEPIAHIMLSFVFAGEPVTISIETRKEVGEDYSTIAGFFRQYELYYVVSEEPDIVALRTTYREPPEDVYLYRVEIPPEAARKLFLQYLGEINRLNEQPSFYNTMTTNCTTVIAMHARALGGELPRSWKVLLSGYFPQLLHERGVLDQSLPYDELRDASLINATRQCSPGRRRFLGPDQGRPAGDLAAIQVRKPNSRHWRFASDIIGHDGDEHTTRKPASTCRLIGLTL